MIDYSHSLGLSCIFFKLANKFYFSLSTCLAGRPKKFSIKKLSNASVFIHFHVRVRCRSQAYRNAANSEGRGGCQKIQSSTLSPLNFYIRNAQSLNKLTGSDYLNVREYTEI